MTNNISWKKYLKNPNKFFAKKINLLNKNNKNYKKNIFIISILLTGAKEIKAGANIDVAKIFFDEVLKIIWVNDPIWL